MANATKTITARHGTFKLYDYGFTHTLLLPYTDGVLEESDGGLDVTHFKNRGQIQATPDLAFGEEHEGKFSFKCRLMEALSTTEATIFDILRNEATATPVASYVGTNWTPTNGAGAEVPTWGFEVLHDASAYTGGKLIRSRYGFCRFTYKISHSLAGSMLEIEGTNYSKYATVTNS